MGKIMKKFFSYCLAVIILSGIFSIFATNTEAEEQYTYVRVCAAGICTVYVYDNYGSLVNVYEELDNP